MHNVKYYAILEVMEYIMKASRNGLLGVVGTLDGQYSEDKIGEIFDLQKKLYNFLSTQDINQDCYPEKCSETSSDDKSPLLKNNLNSQYYAHTLPLTDKEFELFKTIINNGRKNLGFSFKLYHLDKLHSVDPIHQQKKLHFRKAIDKVCPIDDVYDNDYTSIIGKKGYIFLGIIFGSLAGGGFLTLSIAECIIGSLPWTDLYFLIPASALGALFMGWLGGGLFGYLPGSTIGSRMDIRSKHIQSQSINSCLAREMPQDYLQDISPERLAETASKYSPDRINIIKENRLRITHLIDARKIENETGYRFTATKLAINAELSLRFKLKNALKEGNEYEITELSKQLSNLGQLKETVFEAIKSKHESHSVDWKFTEDQKIAFRTLRTYTYKNLEEKLSRKDYPKKDLGLLPRMDVENVESFQC